MPALFTDESLSVGVGDGPIPVDPSLGRSPERAARLLHAHGEILELMASGAELREVLAHVARVLDGTVAPARCALIWCDEDKGSLEHVAGSPLPPALADALRTAAGSAVAADLASATAAFVAACERSGGAAGRHSIRSHAGEGLATVVVLAPGPAPAIGIGPGTLGTLILLVRFALEAERRQRALLSANERFAGLAKAIPGVIYQRVVRPDGTVRYTYISEAARDLFGVSPEEIIADPQALFDCHDKEYHAAFRERLLAASKALALWDVEATIITRDGKRKFTHALARPHRTADGSVVWDGVILDATRIKEAEIAAAAAETRTRDTIVESIPHGFALFDAEGRLVTWNSHLVGLYPALEARLREHLTYAELVRAEIATGVDPVEDGRDPEARFHERMLQHRQADCVMERQLADGRWILVNEHRTADGGLVVLHTDISDLKAREAALRRSNQELEAFASIASHDLQEPLRKIDAFGDRLKRRYQDTLGDDGKMYIDRMQSAVARMRSLINDLLDYSRVTTKARPFAPVDLRQVAAEVVGDLQIRLEAVSGTVGIGDLPTIDADRTQMQQLLQNLIANALKFHRPGVPPVVTLGARLVEKGRQAAPSDRRIEIRVADNGIGFEMKYAERIFGIFQRLHTRAEYEGTGVGLATCRKIVERHGGTIVAESVLDQGTTFVIDLPICQPATETH